jgi:hypothetical protein
MGKATNSMGQMKWLAQAIGRGEGSEVPVAQQVKGAHGAVSTCTQHGIAWRQGNWYQLVAGPTVIPSRPWLSHFIIFHNIWDNPSH